MSETPAPAPRRRLPGLAIALLLLLAAAVLGAAFVYSGSYDIGADKPHSGLVFGMLEQLRDRSIERHSSGLAVPADLNDPKRIATGAGLYGEMCTGCHLGPGVEKSELSQGLYPQAPEFARGSDLSPQAMFWVIKHGVKLSAMPAWGKTHSDDLMWDMVAFTRTLPKLSPEQYQAALASAPAEHDEIMKAMPGMAGTPKPGDHHHPPGTAPHQD